MMDRLIMAVVDAGYSVEDDRLPLVIDADGSSWVPLPDGRAVVMRCGEAVCSAAALRERMSAVPEDDGTAQVDPAPTWMRVEAEAKRLEGLPFFDSRRVNTDRNLDQARGLLFAAGEISTYMAACSVKEEEIGLAKAFMCLREATIGLLAACVLAGMGRDKLEPWLRQA